MLIHDLHTAPNQRIFKKEGQYIFFWWGGGDEADP